MNKHSSEAQTLFAAAYWQMQQKHPDAKPGIITQVAEDHIRDLRAHPEEKTVLLERYKEAARTVRDAKNISGENAPGSTMLTHFQTAELNRKIKKAKKLGVPVNAPVVGDYIRQSFAQEVEGMAAPKPRAR